MATGIVRHTPAPKRKTYSSTPRKSSSGGSGSSGKGSGGTAKTYTDGYNKAVREFNAKKTDDKPLVKALKEMLNRSFSRQRNIALDNVLRGLRQEDALVRKNYNAAAGHLANVRKDNLKAVNDSSYSNIANRARERAESMAQSAAQGAGESDVLKSNLMSLRNWSANQAEVNRSFYDTNRSINGEITDLNNATRTSLANLYKQANKDRESIWNNYYGKRVDTWTQLGNVYANPGSNMYKKGGLVVDKKGTKYDRTAYDRAAEDAARAWKNPGIPASIQNWEGTTKTSEPRLNNTAAALTATSARGDAMPKRPEGATLRKW